MTNNVDAVFTRNLALNERETHERRLVLGSRPVALGLIITNWCNLRCIMCPSQRHTATQTLPPEALAGVPELFPCLARLDWQGGEFFQLRYVQELFARARAYPRIRHYFTTNALLLDDSWLELFPGAQVSLQVSVDSPRREVYEHIRRGADYEQLLARLRRIQEVEVRHGRRIERDLHVVVLRSNHRHLDEFPAFARRYGFRAVTFSPVYFCDSEENIYKDASGELKSELERMRLELERLGRREGVDILWGASPDDGPRPGEPGPGAAGPACLLPWKSLWIDAIKEGAILPDCWCDHPVGTAAEGLLAAWNGERMQDYRRRLAAGDAALCGKCAARRLYPAL